jgi:hypothetical protein
MPTWRHIHGCNQTVSEERNAGNPHATFCGGAASGNWGGLPDLLKITNRHSRRAELGLNEG